VPADLRGPIVHGTESPAIPGRFADRVVFRHVPAALAWSRKVTTLLPVDKSDSTFPRCALAGMISTIEYLAAGSSEILHVCQFD